MLNAEVQERIDQADDKIDKLNQELILLNSDLHMLHLVVDWSATCGEELEAKRRRREQVEAQKEAIMEYAYQLGRTVAWPGGSVKRTEQKTAGAKLAEALQ